MKFEITRTSLWNDADAPCEGCIKEERVERIKVRRYGNYDYSREKNVRFFEENGIQMVEYDVTFITWFRNFDSLEELVAFRDEIDESIILMSENRLEIYDDYRE